MTLHHLNTFHEIYKMTVLTSTFSIFYVAYRMAMSLGHLGVHSVLISVLKGKANNLKVYLLGTFSFDVIARTRTTADSNLDFTAN